MTNGDHDGIDPWIPGPKNDQDNWSYMVDNKFYLTTGDLVFLCFELTA